MERTKRRAAGRVARPLLAAALLAPVGCDWFDDPTPTEARVVFDGDAATPVRIVLSKRFVAGVDAQRVTRVELIRADTFFRTLPFDTTYDIRQERIFFAEGSVLEEELGNFSMQVLVNGERNFDETGPLTADLPFRFVYTFNQFVTSNIDVF